MLNNLVLSLEMDFLRFKRFSETMAPAVHVYLEAHLTSSFTWTLEENWPVDTGGPGPENLSWNVRVPRTIRISLIVSCM